MSEKLPEACNIVQHNKQERPSNLLCDWISSIMLIVITENTQLTKAQQSGELSNGAQIQSRLVNKYYPYETPTSFLINLLAVPALHRKILWILSSNCVFKIMLDPKFIWAVNYQPVTRSIVGNGIFLLKSRIQCAAKTK